MRSICVAINKQNQLEAYIAQIDNGTIFKDYYEKQNCRVKIWQVPDFEHYSEIDENIRKEIREYINKHREPRKPAWIDAKYKDV